MCGIVGVAAPERSVRETELRAGLDAIRHRGPDGDGVFVDVERRVGLGHVRLAIIDVENGAQPIASEDGAVVAVVNGELYDFERIRAALEARGHRFRTGSDSEIAVHLYEEHGDEFVEHLRGELAMLLFDARRRRLIAVRDRFGIKPLVWAEHRGRVLFASEAKALFAMGVPARWDARSLAHVATHQYLPPSRTMFAGVHALPPGHLAIVDERGVAVRRYWHPEPPVETDAAGTDDLAHALDEAVRLRLRADVPVGFYLSGGLDSASVVALAARRLDAPPRTFGVRFGFEPYDESTLALEVARHVGARHEVVDVDQDALVDDLPDAVWFSEGLAINGQLPAKLALARAARTAGVRVVLTGEGADEALLGYPHLVRDALRSSDDPDAARWLADLERESAATRGVMMPDGHAPPLDAVRRALGVVPTWVEAKARLAARVRALAAAPIDTDAVWRDLFAELDVDAVAGRPPVVKAAWLWTELALAGYILRTLGDGTEMAASIEGRTPFLDHRLFEVATSVPIADRVHRGVEKHALREAMRLHLPERVVRRRKHPFLAPPLARWGGARSDALMQDVLRSELPAFFDRRLVAALLDRLPRLDPEARAAFDPPLMLALTAAILERRFALGDPT